MIVATPELVKYYRAEADIAKANGRQKGNLIAQENLEQNGTQKALSPNGGDKGKRPFDAHRYYLSKRNA
jgi:hypothetical protein